MNHGQEIHQEAHQEPEGLGAAAAILVAGPADEQPAVHRRPGRRERQGKTRRQGDAEVQARQVFKNIENLVKEAGGTMDDVVQLTVYVTDIRHAEKVREARGAFFRGEPPTSTLLVISGLASEDMIVEISAIAVLPE